MIKNEIRFKQFIFIPKRPKMSPGKIASQVCHASFLALEKQREVIFKSTGKYEPDQDNIINSWKKSGMCVIVLEAKDTQHLMNIAKYFEQWKIVNAIYIDEGLTEVAPMTPTAVATGVMPLSKHWMLSQFKLYK